MNKNLFSKKVEVQIVLRNVFKSKSFFWTWCRDLCFGSKVFDIKLEALRIELFVLLLPKWFLTFPYHYIFLDRFPIIIYLMSVYWLEYLRIQMCTNVSTFNKLFNYLEDKALQVEPIKLFAIRHIFYQTTVFFLIIILIKKYNL